MHKEKVVVIVMWKNAVAIQKWQSDFINKKKTSISPTVGKFVNIIVALICECWHHESQQKWKDTFTMYLKLTVK